MKSTSAKKKLKKIVNRHKFSKLIRTKRLLPLIANDPALRKLLLKHGDSKLIKTLVEIVHNFLKGSFPVEKNKLQKLKKYKSQIRQIGQPNGKLELKRKVLLQKGSGVILPVILSSLLSSAIGKILE